MCYKISMFSLNYYTTSKDKPVVQEWLESLADKAAAARIVMRIERLAKGHMGDCKPLKDGVWELRIDYGPGYRVYYSKTGKTVVLLLCGGDKRKQDADIERAVAYLEDYKRRSL